MIHLASGGPFQTSRLLFGAGCTIVTVRHFSGWVVRTCSRDAVACRASLFRKAFRLAWGVPPVARRERPQGTVKWFNPNKGYGFIQPDDGSKDVFVHISTVEQAGLGSLSEAQKVSLEVERGWQGKLAAANLKGLWDT